MPLQRLRVEILQSHMYGHLEILKSQSYSHFIESNQQWADYWEVSTAKEVHRSVKQPDISAIEVYISAKEPYNLRVL